MRLTDQSQPNTIHSLVQDFQNLGVRDGMTLIVHSSLKSLGWVCGGEVAVVEALMKAVGKEGTIVMPTQSAQLSEPFYWENPPVPEEWWDTIRKEMPAYDPKTTPTFGMGRVVECFRHYEGVVRSNHPMASFAAWGKQCDAIVQDQPLSFSLGEQSPLQKLYDADAFILLIGVGYENNTSLHLAEYYADSCFTYQQGSPIIENGKRVWKEYEEYYERINALKRKAKDYNMELKIWDKPEDVQKAWKKSESLKAQCEKAELDVESSKTLIKDLNDQYNEIISWSSLYDSATIEAKKMIVNSMVKRVDVYRNYELNVELNMNIRQFFLGMEEIENIPITA